MQCTVWIGSKFLLLLGMHCINFIVFFFPWVVLPGVSRLAGADAGAEGGARIV